MIHLPYPALVEPEKRPYVQRNFEIVVLLQTKGRPKPSLVVIVMGLRRLAASHQTDLNRQPRKQDENERGYPPLREGGDGRGLERHFEPGSIALGCCLRRVERITEN